MSVKNCSSILSGLKKDMTWGTDRQADRHLLVMSRQCTEHYFSTKEKKINKKKLHSYDTHAIATTTLLAAFDTFHMKWQSTNKAAKNKKKTKRKKSTSHEYSSIKTPFTVPFLAAETKSYKCLLKLVNGEIHTQWEGECRKSEEGEVRKEQLK